MRFQFRIGVAAGIGQQQGVNHDTIPFTSTLVRIAFFTIMGKHVGWKGAGLFEVPTYETSITWTPYKEMRSLHVWSNTEFLCRKPFEVQLSTLRNFVEFYKIFEKEGKYIIEGFVAVV